MNIFAKGVFTSVFALGLAACGGDGGDDNDAPPAPPPLEPVEITADNAEEVAGVVVATVGSVTELGDGGILPSQGSGLVSLDSASGEADLPEPDLFKLLANPLNDFQVAATQSFSFDCQVSGRMDIVADIADITGEMFTRGDTVSVTFFSCDQGDGTLVNGKASMVVVVPVDTEFTPPYNFTFDFTFGDLSVTAEGETVEADGDLRISEATHDNAFFETELAGRVLRVVTGGVREILSGFRLSGTVNTADGNYTIDAGGLNSCCATLGSDRLDGSVKFENTLAFEGIGDEPPFAGVMMITGAVAAGGVGPSTVELTVLDSVCVELQVDENGDEQVDATILTTWESLNTGIPDDDCSL